MGVIKKKMRMDILYPEELYLLDRQGFNGFIYFASLVDIDSVKKTQMPRKLESYFRP